MFEYILAFHDQYLVIFYILLIIGVIFEGPIIILALSLASHKLGFNFFHILLFAFIGEFFGDLLHFFTAKFFKKKLVKKDFSVIVKLDKKLKKHSLIDKLIVIKYTPPITSLGLLYIGYSNISLKSFIKSDIFLNIFSAIFITTIGYNFGYLFNKSDDFGYFISLLFISFIIFYFTLKIISKFLIKKVYDSNS